MNQSKLKSWLEVFVNYLTGFILAYITYSYLIMPSPSLVDKPFYVTSIFTLVSIIRTYLWRRFFNAGIHKLIHKVLAK